MVVKYKPTFIKDFNKITGSKEKKGIYKICFEDISKIKSISEFKNLKKIKGYDHYYRIRKGNYRIGFRFEGGEVIFMRVLKRDNVYRYFP